MSEAKVEVTNEKEASKNFFHRFIYRRDGQKFTLLTKKISGALMVCLAFVAVFLVLFGRPPEERQSSEIGFPEARVDDNNSDPSVNLAGFQSTLEPTASSQTSHRGKRGKTFTGPQLVSRPRIAVPPGTMAKAKLLTGASNGSVRAELREPVRVNGEVAVEAGTLLFGTGTSADARLLIQFNQMAFKDGAFETTQAQAWDPEDKLPGIGGSLLGHRALKIAGSIGLNFLGGFSEGLQDTEVKNGAAFKPGTLKNAFLNGTAKTALEESRDLMSSVRNSQPVVIVDAGKEILIVWEVK